MVEDFRNKPIGLSTIWVIVIGLIAIWIVARVVSWALGGLIDVLLVIALILVIVRLWQGKRLV